VALIDQIVTGPAFARIADADHLLVWADRIFGPWGPTEFRRYTPVLKTKNTDGAAYQGAPLNEGMPCLLPCPASPSHSCHAQLRPAPQLAVPSTRLKANRLGVVKT
jgi:hypothetical protein